MLLNQAEKKDSVFYFFKVGLHGTSLALETIVTPSLERSIVFVSVKPVCSELGLAEFTNK